MSELYVIPNDAKRECKTCGLIHPYISNGSEGRPCDTPAVFTHGFLERAGGLEEFIEGKPVQPAVFDLPEGGRA